MMFALAAMTLLLIASPARADWLRAESERFIVYTDGREAEARAYIQTLESFDRLLRISMGLDVNEAPVRKLPIYLVGSRRDLVRVVPDIGDSVVGVYVPADEDIFALAIRTRGDDFVLLHEYAHHFMMQNFSYPYPAWFVEGFAEYYMTAQFRNGAVEVGRFHENRGYWLQSSGWLPMETLLTSRPGEVRRNAETYYPLAWLLTHWFMGDESRRPQLHAYMLDIGQGGDPVDAMERATGLSPADLRRTLQSYMRGRIPYARLTYDFPVVEPVITRLPASADDLLLLGQRLKVGVRDERRADTADEVRRFAARHGDDPFARLTLGHAELHFGDAATGEAILTDLLAEEPDNVEALQLMATARMAQARENPENHDDLMGLARNFLQRAYQADDLNYYTLYLIANSRVGAATYPNDNDLLTWNLAYQVAPQLASTRFGYARALMEQGQAETAIIILGPLANAPHGGEAATRAQALIDEASGLSPEEGVQASQPGVDEQGQGPGAP